jgi:putative NADPH-quinone reductase
MKIQVVHCHPLTDSFDHSLFLAIVETLRNNGHEVIATDLYREGFQAAMTESERRSYMDNDYDLSEVADYADTLKEVDGLIRSGGSPCRRCSRAGSIASGGQA